MPCMGTQLFTERPELANILQHRIDTADAKPLGCNPRPLCVHKQAFIDKVFDEMIDTGAVQQSQSPWSFPAVVVQKKKDITAPLASALTIADLMR